MPEPTQEQIEAAIEAFCKSAGYPMDARCADGSQLRRDLIAALKAAALLSPEKRRQEIEKNGHD